MRTCVIRLCFASLLCLPAASLAAQRNRLSGPADNSRRFTLRGHIHPKVQGGEDQGQVDPSFMLPHLTLVLQPSASEQAELDQLLASQQDPSSPNYHHWLTPEQYADRFGASQDDLSKIVSWLQDRGLTVLGIGRGRNAVEFRGTAEQVGAALGTEIHRYRVDGALHFANASEPSLPAAFQGVVSGIHGLNDFRLRSPRRSGGNPVQPNYNSSRGSHYLAPDDVATIYNIKPLYNTGIDATGQTIVVAGQTQIHLSDIQQYRTYFNLPANDPKVTLVPNTRDPGIRTNDMEEADLDLELAGAVARNATIVYVYSADVMDAVQYAIDQNLGQVLSLSYGMCEAGTPAADAQTLQSWAKQGNAQGITWFTASGDSGGADCAGGNSRVAASLSVDLPAGIPEVTGVGGTEFNEGSGNYWDTSNSDNRASVLSYMPEVAWNDSLADGQPSASGGGASVLFSKPSWQTGAGVPDDSARDVPDVSLMASANHDGSLIYTNGSLRAVGGTSVAAPAFAGIAALLNHYLVANGLQTSAGLGNMNPRLYSLAQSRPDAFHDITTGDNVVTPCSARSRFCQASPIGYNSGNGYDRVTGLGSVDVYNLVTAWHDTSAASRLSVSVTLAAGADSLMPADVTTLVATVTSGDGGTPTGAVTFYAGDTVLGTATLAGAGGNARASLDLNGAQLAGANGTVTVQYSGDNAYGTGAASFTITVAQPDPAPPGEE
jgi:subtilase family serine protease